jgi:glycosyltransferase involved in cell wall biosynthesis
MAIKKMMLSLCMVTMNDEKYLLSCLQNIKETVDEVIIVDVGSSDHTVEIAKQAGANVYEMEWNKSYSEAKNVCLNKAKGRWVLFLQANETITVQQQKEIPTLLRNPNVEGYLMYVDHHLEQNYLISSPVQSLRLIRNRKEYRFQYRAFERIQEGVLMNVLDAGIRIIQQHRGMPSDEKYSPSLLLQIDLKENVKDRYLQYMVGIELLNKQRYEESKKYFQNALDYINTGYLFTPHLYKCLSWVHLFLGEHNEALNILEDGINLFPFYTDLAVLRAEIWKQKHQYKEAISDLCKSIKISEQHQSIVPKPEIHLSIILEMLGELHEQIFNDEQALVYYLKSYQISDNNPELLRKIGGLSLQLGAIEVIENLQKEAMEQNNVEHLMIVVESLFQSREYTKVLETIHYVEAMIEDKDQIRTIQYFCHMMLGEVEKAEHQIDAIKKESPSYHYTLLQRIESYWLHNKWEEVQQLIVEMDQLETIDVRTKVLYHSLHRLLSGEDQNVEQFLEQDFEKVLSLTGNFLFLNQDEKAKLLLPLLLNGTNEDQYSQIAELWAIQNDYDTVEQIFQCISKVQNQLKFKQKIIIQLLRHDHIESAQKLAKSGDYHLLGVLENVLWARSTMKNLKKWLGKVQRKFSVANLTQPLLKPSEGLITFYKQLKAVKKNTIESIIEKSEKDFNCSDVHVAIGGIFEATQKKREALCAFLRALQWDPLNKMAQKKMKELYHENPSYLQVNLEKQDLILEGDVFICKESFINFISGILEFQNEKYDQAFIYFSNNRQKKISSQQLGYIISCLWMMGEEEQAEKWLTDKNITFEVLSSFFRICQQSILERLEQSHQEYLHSEIIRVEKEKIKKCKFNLEL